MSHGNESLKDVWRREENTFCWFDKKKSFDKPHLFDDIRNVTHSAELFCIKCNSILPMKQEERA